MGSTRSLSGHLSVRGSPSARGNGKRPFPLFLVLLFRTPKLIFPSYQSQRGDALGGGGPATLREALSLGEGAPDLRAAGRPERDRFQAGSAGGSAQPSKELKGGDVGCHASLGRLCAANKKCVSACQSVTASGPSVQLSFSLSLLSLSPRFSLPIAPSLFPLFRQRLLHSNTNTS